MPVFPGCAEFMSGCSGISAKESSTAVACAATVTVDRLGTMLMIRVLTLRVALTVNWLVSGGVPTVTLQVKLAGFTPIRLDARNCLALSSVDPGLVEGLRRRKGRSVDRTL